VRLDRLGLEPPAQPLHGAVDLRPVAAPDQVGRSELVRHRREA
jgi:hypothetical protein